MDHAMTKFVSREPKRMSKILNGVMLAFTILFVLMGIIFDRGMLLLSMLMVVLYWINSMESVRDYEYRLENEVLTIDVIKGKQRRKTVQEIELGGLEVIAPNCCWIPGNIYSSNNIPICRTVRQPSFCRTRIEILGISRGNTFQCQWRNLIVITNGYCFSP